MVKQLTINIWCDLCLKDGQRSTAVMRSGTISVSIDGATPLSLDLCPAHRRQLIEPVSAALDEHGVDREGERPERTWRPKPGRRVGPFLCLADCGRPPLKNSDTLAAHLKGVHDMTLSEYKEKYGELVPMTFEEQAHIVSEARCHVLGCGKLYSTKLGHRWPQQALRSHLIGRHGLIGDAGSKR